MSLECPVGPEGNLLETTPEQCARLLVPSPVLSLQEMEALKSTEHRGWKAVTLDASIDAAEAQANPNALREALRTLCAGEP